MKVPQSFTLISREGLVLILFRNCTILFHIQRSTSQTVITRDLSNAGMPNRGADLETEERQPRSMRGQGDPGQDVFCLVKQNMSDSCLSQRPILVLPSALMGRTGEFFQRLNDPGLALTGGFTPERVEELQLLKKNIEKDFPHMTRAMKYYEDAMNPRLSKAPFTQITFCNHAAADPGRWHRINLGERAPPPRPHALQVVYHHRARV